LTSLDPLEGNFFSPVAAKRISTDRSGLASVVRHRLGGYEIDHWAVDVSLWVEQLCLVLVKVLARVGCFVFQRFDELIECRSEQ